MKKKWEDERDTKNLEEDIANLLIKQTMDPEHSTGTAKGTDAFGRTKGDCKMSVQPSQGASADLWNSFNVAGADPMQWFVEKCIHLDMEISDGNTVCVSRFGSQIDSAYG